VDVGKADTGRDVVNCRVVAVAPTPPMKTYRVRGQPKPATYHLAGSGRAKIPQSEEERLEKRKAWVAAGGTDLIGPGQNRRRLEVFQETVKSKRCISSNRRCEWIERRGHFNHCGWYGDRLTNSARVADCFTEKVPRKKPSDEPERSPASTSC
jgi:hypothetical protein